MWTPLRPLQVLSSPSPLAAPTEDAACNRIEAARAGRRFPVILDLLASGEMTLTSVRLLGRHLTPENHQAVLARAGRRSRPEIEALVAELAPRPDVPTSVRKLPTLTATPPPSAAPAQATIGAASEPTRPVAPASGRSFRPPVRSSRPPRRSATGCSSPSAPRPTRSFGALRRFCGARSRTVIPAPSSTAPSRCCWSGSRTRSSGRPRGRGRRSLSVLKRISPANRFRARAMFHGRSSEWSGGATLANAPSSLPPGGGARSGPSWSSTTFSPMRGRAGHRREHLAALSASQQVRGRADLRASPASIVWPGAGSGTVIEPERVERIGARS